MGNVAKVEKALLSSWAEIRSAEVDLTLLIIWVSATLLWSHTESVKFLSTKFLHATRTALSRPSRRAHRTTDPSPKPSLMNRTVDCSLIMVVAARKIALALMDFRDYLSAQTYEEHLRFETYLRIRALAIST